MYFTDVNAASHLTRDSIVVDSLAAKTPSTMGTFHMTGALDRTNPAIPIVNAELAAKGVRVLDTRDRGRLDVDAKLTIAGPTTKPYIYGSTTILTGVFYLAPATSKNLVDLSQPVVYHVVDTAKPGIRALLPAPGSLFSRLLMDVDFTVDRTTWVRNEDANVEAYTEDPLTLHVDRDHEALVVNGTINTDAGEYRFLGKRFTITKGVATFIGATSLNPTVSANAQYMVSAPGQQALAITVNITGNIDSLRLALSSNNQPPLSQSDLLSYLAFGSAASGIAQASQSSSLTSASSGGALGTAGVFVENQLAAQAVGVLVDQATGELARAINADVLHVTVANNYVDIAQNRNNAGETFIQNTQLEFGKYFTPRTYVSLQASVAPGANVIHRVTPTLSLQLSGQSLYLLGQPTLATQQDTPLIGVFGLSLTKTWRF
jgi:autotransporter translocation and assembly factor TamB